MNLFPKILLVVWVICLPTLIITFNSYVSLNKPIDFNSELKLGKQNFNIIANNKCVGSFTFNFYEEELSTYRIETDFLLSVKVKDEKQKITFESILQFNPFLQLASTSNRLKFANYVIVLTSFGINNIRYFFKVYKDKTLNLKFNDRVSGPFELKQVSADTFILSNFNIRIFEEIDKKFPDIINKQGLKIERSDRECNIESLEITDTNINPESFSKILN